MSESLLRVEGLSVECGGRTIVRGVSFELQRGEMFGIVGRSGAGKSTLVRALLRLIEPSAGRVLWRGSDLSMLSRRELRNWRREAQIVFQEPALSLDPRLTVAESVAEPLAVHRLPRGADRIAELLQAVGLGSEMLARRPRQISTGQAQRVALARALATRPALLVADEALSSLDPSVRAQMANLLGSLRAAMNLACILVTHDLRLAAHLCDRIGVIADGELVDLAAAQELLSAATHPQTRELLDAEQPRSGTLRRFRSLEPT